MTLEFITNIRVGPGEDEGRKVDRYIKKNSKRLLEKQGFFYFDPDASKAVDFSKIPDPKTGKRHFIGTSRRKLKRYNREMGYGKKTKHIGLWGIRRPKR